MIYVWAFLIGVIAGLRAMTAPACVSWAARLGWLHLENTPLAFGYAATPYVFSLFAVGELINDKLPKTPSRKAALPFGARILTGAFSGAAIGATTHTLFAGLILGALGAVVGTFGGYELRARLANAFGKDLPAALIEDAIAIVGGFIVVQQIA